MKGIFERIFSGLFYIFVCTVLLVIVDVFIPSFGNKELRLESRQLRLELEIVEEMLNDNKKSIEEVKKRIEDIALTCYNESYES